jgi:hypothetical protein
LLACEIRSRWLRCLSRQFHARCLPDCFGHSAVGYYAHVVVNGPRITPTDRAARSAGSETATGAPAR